MEEGEREAVSVSVIPVVEGLRMNYLIENSSLYITEKNSNHCSSSN